MNVPIIFCCFLVLFWIDTTASVSQPTKNGKAKETLLHRGSAEENNIDKIANETHDWIQTLPKHQRMGASLAHGRWYGMAKGREAKLEEKLKNIEKSRDLALAETEKCWQSIHFRALLDIFVTHRYPYWLGPPPLDKVEKWQHMFLNFGDKFVRAIKVILQKNGMSESLFLELNILGNYKNIGTEVHPTHLTKEQIAIIKRCMEGWPEYLKNIIDIMLVSLEKSSLDETYEKYNVDVPTLLSNPKVQYAEFVNAHRMLKIVKVNINYIDESKLSQVFKKKLVGTWYDKTTDTAYILFPNFEIAYEGWEMAKNKAEFLLKDFLAFRSNIVLIDPASLDQYSKVRTIKVVGAINATRYEKEFTSEKEMPIVQSQPDVVFFIYSNLCNALEVYERNRENNIKSIYGKQVVLELISKWFKS